MDKPEEENDFMDDRLARIGGVLGFAAWVIYQVCIVTTRGFYYGDYSIPGASGSFLSFLAYLGLAGTLMMAGLVALGIGGISRHRIAIGIGAAILFCLYGWQLVVDMGSIGTTYSYYQSGVFIILAELLPCLSYGFLAIGAFAKGLARYRIMGYLTAAFAIINAVIYCASSAQLGIPVGGGAYVASWIIFSLVEAAMIVVLALALYRGASPISGSLS